MSEAAASPSRVPWPPLIYVAAVAAAIALGIVYPLPWIGQPMSDLLFAGGCLIVAAALAIEIAALRTLLRANTTFWANRAAAHLVTGGPFSFTRNPIYFGNTLLVIGIGLVAGSLWFLLAAFVAAFLTSKLAIEPEERHLAARFGKRYHDYAKRVRRWI